MNTFIKVIEVWTPTADRRQLRLADGIFNTGIQFETKSRQAVFCFNQGLPGKTWAMGFPQIINDLGNSDFVRKQDAVDANLESGVAFPIFAGEFLIAVVVFLCGGAKKGSGAIELWGSDAETPEALKFMDGYYGSLSVLEFMSRRRSFNKGEGLPGTVWDYNLPILIDDPVNSAIFLRRGNAQNDGISMAFGVPYILNENELVMTFLSTVDSPIARRCEIWVPERNHKHLFFHSGKCELVGNLALVYKNTKINRGEGLIGNAWLTGCPQICHDVNSELQLERNDVLNFKYKFVLPLIDNGLLRSLVVMYF